MSKKKSQAPTPEVHLRLHLAQVSKVCAAEGRRPCEVVLLVGRFAPENASVIPRTVAKDTMGAHRLWPAIAELLARPCKENEVLYVVSDGEAVVGRLVPLLEIVPTTEQAALQRALGSKLTVVREMVEVLLQRGRELQNFIAILDEGRQPAVMPRGSAEIALKTFGWGDFTHLLGQACERDDLLIFYKVNGRPDWGTMKLADTPLQP